MAADEGGVTSMRSDRAKFIDAVDEGRIGICRATPLKLGSENGLRGITSAVRLMAQRSPGISILSVQIELSLDRHKELSEAKKVGQATSVYRTCSAAN